MRVIETLFSTGLTVTIDGAEFPAECVVEDDDGTRIVILQDLTHLTQEVFRRTYEYAAAYASPLDDQWAVVPISGVTDGRINPTSIQLLDHFPTNRDLLVRKVSDFVHLHSHSDASALDGLSTIDEMVAKVVEHGQPGLAITDHGTCANHPKLQSAAKGAGIRPIYGIEANYVRDRLNREKDDLKAYRHLILWAKTDEGLRNLWAMSTESYRTGFYGRARMDPDLLRTYREGVMASTACLRGPLSDFILNDEEERARMALSELMGIFGDDLFVELQTNAGEEQAKVNRGLITLANDYSLPLFVASDSHYTHSHDKETHRIWLAIQTNNELQDDMGLFGNHEASYHLMSAEEVADSISYLPEAVVKEAMANTVAIAERTSVAFGSAAKPPIFSKGETTRDKDYDRLVKRCIDNWGKVQGRTQPEEVYMERLERELKLLRSKGFEGVYLMVADYCSWAKDHGILRGPGRGSGASSLVAYLCNITGVDPIESDLMFERFLTEGRVSLPDFDVDFPASKRQEITDYIIGRYGEENVVRVGTHIKLKNKGVIRDLARVMKSTWDINYADINAISKAIDEAEGDSAGIGKPWDELWPQIEEDMAPYVAKYPDLFPLAEKLVGRIKTYGKHAAGLVIAPDANLTQSLPLRTAGKEVVAEFDMESLEALGLVKFDLLTLSTLDKIQMTVDLIRETTGDIIDPDSWVDEYRDPYVWDQICAGHTLGIFQIETPGGTREVKEMQPRSIDELSDVIALVRPGPKNSGLTATYLRRKRGEEPITYMDERLEPILRTTQGAMIYQEQVLKTCMELAGYNETEADDVRKILGKKKVDLVEAEGRRFVSRAVENGTDKDVAETIWMQMAEFSKYAFNRVHSYSYATLAWWTAWLKFTYPAQFLTASLSTVDKDRIPDYINEASRMGYRVLPPDINLSGRGFSYKGIEIRYGFDGVKGIGPAVVDALVENQPYASLEDFMERKAPKANMGAVRTLAKVGAFDSLTHRKNAEFFFEWHETLGEKCTAWDDELVCDIEGCTHKREEYNDLPCNFPWKWEPVEIGKSGKPLKPKPVPKRCTKACRNYQPREYPGVEGEYSPEEIQEREKELLGVYLSSTPFDRIPGDLWGADNEIGIPVVTGTELEDADQGYYLIPGLITRVKPHTTSTGKAMGFVGVLAYDMEVDVVVFSEQWARYKPELKSSKLLLMAVTKTDRGYTMQEVQVV